MSLDGTAGAGPALYPLFPLELHQGSSDVEHIGRLDFQGKVVEGMDLDRSLDGKGGTSFLHSVQVMEDLVKPISLFSTSSSRSATLTELERSIVFLLFTTSSKLPTSAAYSSCASCCSKFMSPSLTALISPNRCSTLISSSFVLISR